MFTNPLCAAGLDATNVANYTAYQFNYHQVVISGSLYDAAAAQRYDLSGSTYLNPPWAWGKTGYWHTSDSPSPHLGLVDFLFNPAIDPPTPTGTVTDFEDDLIFLEKIS